jgi:hypothetical protein
MNILIIDWKKDKTGLLEYSNEKELIRSSLIIFINFHAHAHAVYGQFNNSLKLIDILYDADLNIIKEKYSEKIINMDFLQHIDPETDVDFYFKDYYYLKIICSFFDKNIKSGEKESNKKIVFSQQVFSDYLHNKSNNQFNSKETARQILIRLMSMNYVTHYGTIFCTTLEGKRWAKNIID